MKKKSLVSIIMGSQSDWPIMKLTSKVLKEFEIAHEVKIISAHRTPKRMFEFAEKAEARGIKIIIAGAGGAAHLPGMTASISNLPVLGVPIESKKIKRAG
jgi:5-(carboxyamino)imidazole ribonucleotide mutase